MAIATFKCSETETAFNTGRSKRFATIRKALVEALLTLNAAATLRDVYAVPGNHAEALKGDRKGQHSIRVTGKWRLCFVWTAEGPADVECTNHYGD